MINIGHRHLELVLDLTIGRNAVGGERHVFADQPPAGEVRVMIQHAGWRMVWATI